MNGALAAALMQPAQSSAGSSPMQLAAALAAMKTTKTLPDGRADMTDQYNTQLSPDDEAKFQQWSTANNREGDLADYDMRGAWAAGAGQSGNGHFTDQFKKPNHPTFSVESQYNGVDGYQGGQWGGDDAHPTFTPSQTNLDNLPGKGLQSYFSNVEPDTQLVMPQAQDQSGFGIGGATQ